MALSEIRLPSSLYGFLYVSRLAAGSRPCTVADIARDARGRNSLDGITGLLVFDGEGFAQFVEGPSPAVASLHDRIALDKRHVDVLTLWHGPLDGARRFPNWRLGYLLMEDSDQELGALRALRGDAAITAFCRLTAHLDVGSGFTDTVRPAEV